MMELTGGLKQGSRPVSRRPDGLTKYLHSAVTLLQATRQRDDISGRSAKQELNNAIKFEKSEGLLPILAHGSFDRYSLLL
ncbi:hypothetical protein FOPG_19069 [Fusarium oxysporum f. sp. conglutinans race 2 54008]|uniref:Uncharacterized protein n=1 Tax=Fusarium oxysporum f. sp. conglutinans race 2 54008 TaxID=1089457 RepID=X0GM18_FUSOX|nr:hypothetical protein FOPG_19069 [Fusarium oxysporum f. sp. conglutinans race 2 54008]